MWYGDIGCQAGSRIFTGNITEVAKHGGEWKPYTIQNDSAFGVKIAINFRFLESLRKLNPNKFEIVSWDFADEKYGGEDGGSNFSANKFNYIVEQEDWSPWKITQKTLLKQSL